MNLTWRFSTHGLGLGWEPLEAINLVVAGLFLLLSSVRLRCCSRTPEELLGRLASAVPGKVQ